MPLTDPDMEVGRIFFFVRELFKAKNKVGT